MKDGQMPTPSRYGDHVRGRIQEDLWHCLKLVMQKHSVCASRVLGASREDRGVKKESMLGLELSLMKHYDA